MKHILLILSLILSGFSSASIVVPVFEGSWYLDRTGEADVSHYLDGCDNNIYGYKKLSSSLNDIVNSAKSTLPAIPGCLWKLTGNGEQSSAEPQTFPGTESQWKSIYEKDISNKMSFKDKYPSSMIFQYECENGSGSVVKSKSYVFYPVYVCPFGSRKVEYVGCVTNPPLCEADVLGRNLKTPIFSNLGHVALAYKNSYPSTSSENYLVEVLNKNIVVNLDTFSSFLLAAPFWGEAYSPSVKPKLTRSEADLIIGVASGVPTSFVDYTILPKYSIGGFEKKYVYNIMAKKLISFQVQVPSTFRCDTFIVYCYLKGANIALENLSPFITPSSLFHNKFLKYRSAFPYAYESFKNVKAHSPLTEVSQNCSDAACTKEELSELLSQGKIDPDAISNALDNYIKYTNNKAISDEYIYDLSRKYPSNSTQRAILMQELILQKPLELVNKIIQNYQPQDAKNVIPLITTTLILNKPPVTGTKDIGELKSIIAAQNLIVNILKNSNNKEEVFQAIKYMNTIFPNTTYYFMLAEQAAERVGIQIPTNMSLSKVSMKVINEGLNSQKSYTALIQENANQFHIEESSLRLAVISLLSSNLGEFSKSQQIKIKTLLNQTRPNCGGLAYRACSDSMLWWIELSKRVNDFSPSQLINLKLKLLIGLKNPKLSAEFFESRRPEAYFIANKNLLEKLQQKFKQAQISDTSNKLYQGVLSNMRYIFKYKPSDN